MGTAQTTIESFKILQPELNNLPDLNNRENAIFEVFRKAKCRLTDRDIAKFLGWSINRVTPRRGDLAKKGYIEEAGLDYDFETNRRVQTWRLTNRV